MSPSIPMPLRAAAGLAAVAIDEARRLPDRLVGLPVLAVSTALQVSLKAQQRYVELVARGDSLLEQLRGQQEATPRWARFDDEGPYRPAEAGPSAFDTAEPAGEEAGELGDFGGTDLEDLAAGLVPEPAGVEPVEVAAPPEPAGTDSADSRPTGTGPAGTGPIGTGPIGTGYAGNGPAVGGPGAATEVGSAGPRPEEEIDTLAADPAPYDGYLGAEPPLPNYDQLTLAQLRGKLRTLSEAQLAEIVVYERGAGQRPAFLTMLENRLAMLRSH